LWQRLEEFEGADAFESRQLGPRPHQVPIGSRGLPTGRQIGGLGSRIPGVDCSFRCVRGDRAVDQDQAGLGVRSPWEARPSISDARIWRADGAAGIARGNRPCFRSRYQLIDLASRCNPLIAIVGESDVL